MKAPLGYLLSGDLSHFKGCKRSDLPGTTAHRVVLMSAAPACQRTASIWGRCTMKDLSHTHGIWESRVCKSELTQSCTAEASPTVTYVCVCTHSQGKCSKLAELSPAGFQHEYESIRAETCIQSLSATSLSLSPACRQSPGRRADHLMSSSSFTPAFLSLL